MVVGNTAILFSISAQPTNVVMIFCTELKSNFVSIIIERNKSYPKLG